MIFLCYHVYIFQLFRYLSGFPHLQNEGENAGLLSKPPCLNSSKRILSGLIWTIACLNSWKMGLIFIQSRGGWFGTFLGKSWLVVEFLFRRVEECSFKRRNMSCGSVRVFALSATRRNPVDVRTGPNSYFVSRASVKPSRSTAFCCHQMFCISLSFLWNSCFRFWKFFFLIMDLWSCYWVRWAFFFCRN